MATINVAAGASIQAAINSAANGDIISLAAGATYYETININGLDIDIQGNGACIDGSMAEYRNGSTLWTPQPSFVGALSGLTYMLWKTVVPASYAFNASSVNEYGSIRMAEGSGQGDLFWHYDSLNGATNALMNPEQPQNMGEGYFVDSNRDIWMISATDPNTRNLWIGQTTPTIAVYNGSTVNVSDLEAKISGRYLFFILDSTVSLANVDNYNGGINVSAERSTIDIIGGSSTQNYDDTWGWAHIKAGRMEEIHMQFQDSVVDIVGTDVISGFNGIVASDDVTMMVDDVFVRDAGDDAFEFETTPNVVVKNSYVSNALVGFSTAPIANGGSFHGYNNLVHTVPKNETWDWTTQTWSTLAGGAVKQYHGNAGTSTTDVHHYNSVLYGPRGYAGFSLQSHPVMDLDIINSIVVGTGEAVLNSTGQAANGVDLKSLLLWAENFTPTSYGYLDTEIDVGAENPSMNLSGQTLPAAWTDLVEADPGFANPGPADSRAGLIANFAIAETSPACDVPTCPIPSDWPCAAEANDSDCVGLVRAVEITGECSFQETRPWTTGQVLTPNFVADCPYVAGGSNWAYPDDSSSD